ncbi:MAG: hypothetical protein Kow0027_02160 [Saprospiraceae bacterium]
MKSLYSLFLFLFFGLSANGQQTVGLFLNDSLAFNGYTLFAPLSSRTTYLIDNCGELINSWESNFNPGVSTYLLENGHLLRTARIPSAFNAGGTGGRIEEYDWDGNLLWAYDYSSADYHQHHDIHPMPNGNILVLAWEKISEQEAIDLGRNPTLINNQGLWPESIVELKPIGSDSAEIVWEWHAIDHIVQDFDPNLPNYGNPADHPEKLDINYGAGTGSGPGGFADWIHGNGLSYNPDLDQIILCSRRLHEFYIIDHSTTSAEAAGSSGGNSGRGGDLLYRWGNPEAYGRGTVADKTLFGPHNAHWIPNGMPGAGNVLVFNNGVDRPSGFISTVDEVDTPLLPDGNYQLDAGLPYGPSGLVWSYMADPPQSFYSSNISGAQRLPNGNTLICEGDDGLFFEVTPDGQEVWRYVNPVNGQGPIVQGNNTGQNSVFRAIRYGTDYPAFDGKDLTPQGPIELNPIPGMCSIFNAVEEVKTDGNLFHLVANPVTDVLKIQNPEGQAVNYRILNLAGQLIASGQAAGQNLEIAAGGVPAGMYLVQLFDESRMEVLRFVKI